MSELLKKRGSVAEVARPALPTLESGASLTKLGRRGSPHTRTFKLSTCGSLLEWKSPSFFKSEVTTKVDMSNVMRITRGQSTVPFQRCKANDKVAGKDEQSFSIIYEDYRGFETSLDLVAGSVDEANKWFKELGDLIKYLNEEKCMMDPVLRFAKRTWDHADTDKSGSLELKEIEKVIQRLNINLEKSYIKAMFKSVDVDNNGVLDFQEFLVLMEKLSKRSDIFGVWNALVNGSMFESGATSATSAKMSQAIEKTMVSAGELKTQKISSDVFHRFLTEVQKMPVTLEQTKIKIAAMKAEGEAQDDTVSYRGFVSYLTHGDNSAFGTDTSVVYQDMDQPLAHYWIASSHNTYLEGDQLKSNSSVSRYINDLVKGCRCVELDCWDGKDGEPIIFHGHTITGQIKFYDVIKAVADYSFKNSEFPVILSFENHCSIPQQQRMAAICKELLKDMLCVPELRADGSMPSPNDLKGKVIIKAKRLKKKSSEEEEEEEIDDDELEQKQEAKTAGMEQDAAEGITRTKSASSPKKAKKPKIAEELSEITFLAGVHFKSWEQSKNEAASNEMSSFSEPKTDKFLSKCPGDWADYNKRQMSRIYPAGKRIDSSNYDPVPSWNVGSQIVALNYQTGGVSMHLNDGKYRDNGKAGYLLKPAFLRDPGAKFDINSGPFDSSERMNLKVEITSCCQLPKPGGTAKGEVIDPYVKVELHGVPRDEKKFRTKTIDNNGFNPVFNETFSFPVVCKSLGLLYISVWDDDTMADDFIAYASVPLTALRPGIRNFQLYSFNGADGGEFGHASVMCKITIE